MGRTDPNYCGFKRLDRSILLELGSHYSVIVEESYNYGKVSESSPPGVSGIGIMTAGRPVLLQRALVSYVTQTMASRPGLEYIVFDDSKESSERRASFEVARAAQERFSVRIRFAGLEERAGYVRRLQECSSAPQEVLEYALLGRAGYTLGQNRNALLLDTAGSLFFAADDDTVCAPALLPEPAESRLAVCGGPDPSEYWCFPEFAVGRSWARFVTTDFLAAHEQLLGRSVRELNPTTENRANDQQPAGLWRRLASPDSRVKVTLNGLLGDCAWGAPFGVWHQPMGYLAFNDASLERLITTEKHYRESILSRQLLRITPGPVISDLSFSMLPFWAFDNRELLPPNLPNHRGQDLIFGQTLWICFENAVAGHIPLALVHDPVPPRRFWPGEMQRSAAGVDVCRVILEAIKICNWDDATASPAQRLQTLGEHLKQLAELPTEVLAASLMERLHESNRLLENILHARAKALIDRAPYYADDVSRYLAALKVAQSREHYWLPLDLFLPRGAAEVAKSVRQTFMNFGALLAWWPTMVEAAKLLRQSGVRMSVTV